MLINLVNQSKKKEKKSNHSDQSLNQSRKKDISNENLKVFRILEKTKRETLLSKKNVFLRWYNEKEKKEGSFNHIKHEK